MAPRERSSALTSANSHLAPQQVPALPSLPDPGASLTLESVECAPGTTVTTRPHGPPAGLLSCPFLTLFPTAPTTLGHSPCWPWPGDS